MIPAPASRLVARRVGWVVVIGVIALTLFAVAKHLSMGGLAGSEIAEGEAAVARFIEGDPKAVDEAEAAFADAASVSPLDYYPAFGISVTRRLVELRNGDLPRKPGDEVLSALNGSDWESARRHVDAMRDSDPRRAEYYDRFVESVRQASTNSE